MSELTANRASQSSTLATKLVPPPSPPSLIPRPRLEARLGEALERRLTVVVAAAGFGKSTLLATWAGSVNSAWYSLTGEDAALGTLLRGAHAALRLRVPGLPSDLAGVFAAPGPDAAHDEAGRAQAAAAALSQALQEQLTRDLVFVLDDVHELAGAAGSAHFVESLCRQAPARCHVVLASRAEPPFRIDRLRGQGQVLELDGSDLALDVDEISTLVVAATGGEASALAEALHETTGGWPAAVRLAVEALRSVPHAEWPTALARMRRPGSSLFGYLAGEVFAQERPEVRELVRTVAPLERFTPELCEALGAVDSAAVVGSLARRGLFVEPRGRWAGWYSLSTLVREYALASLDLEEAEIRRVREVAAAWLERAGQLDEALDAFVAAGAVEAVARLLRQHGSALLASGAVDLVERAVELVPLELRDAHLEQLAGEARQIRGDWDGAIACYERASGGTARLPCALAWRLGLIHHLRGRIDEALAVYTDADESDGDDRDRALLLAWRASVHWLRGDAEECRADALQAFEIASAARDPKALAAAHTVLAMIAALEGDRAGNDAQYLQALDYAEQAGDVLQLIRVRTNRGSRHLEEGAYEEAIAELDQALRLADLAGFASFRALGLTNRGEARHRLGRLDEAVADLEAARRLYQGLGSRMVAYPLQKLGDVYRARGDWALARAAFEEALAQVEPARDVQGLVPTLAGLAVVLATEEPEEADQLAQRAIDVGPGMAYVKALLAAAFVALVRDRPERAAERAEEAAAEARLRRDRAGLAEALELQALAASDSADALERVREAIALWRDLRAPLDEARAQLVEALVLGDRARVDAAERRLLALGARGYSWSPSRLAQPRARSAIAIQTLGRFRVVRGGVPVPLTAWQSRKARDLLKILASRRGRPTPRETLMEALWPEQEPERLGSRLSVALSTLRAVLDPEKRFDADHLVAADRSSLWLQLEHVAVDVEWFLNEAAGALDDRRRGSPGWSDRLARAEAAYVGDFLEEDAYEDWALMLREEARAVYVDVVRALAEHATGAGEPDVAARFFLRLLEKDAYDERAHLGLVGVLQAGGRHGEARRAFQAYCARMEEIGVESAAFPAEARVASG